MIEAMNGRVRQKASAIADGIEAVRAGKLDIGANGRVFIAAEAAAEIRVDRAARPCWARAVEILAAEEPCRQREYAIRPTFS